MIRMSSEEMNALASEFTYSGGKAGIIGGYCEPDFPIYYVNAEMVEMLGYNSLEELIKAIDGKVGNTIHPDDMEQVRKDIGETYYEGLTYETTYRMPKKDGSWFWTVDKGKVIRTKEGRLAIISICTDMTRFLSRQKELETQSAAADYMFKNIPGGYHRCAMDAGYTFLYVSERFLSLLGWTKEELQTKFHNQFANLIHPEDRNIAPEYVERIVNNTLDRPYQNAMYRLQCKSGYRWFSDTTVKVTVGAESFFQGVITDIDTFLAEKQQRYEIISSLGSAYEEICQVNFREESYQMISGPSKGENGSFAALKQVIQEKKIAEEDKVGIISLLDEPAIQSRLRDSNTTSWDIRAHSGSWYTISVIVQNRDSQGNVMQVLMAAQNTTEQKHKELEYQSSLEEGLFAIADGFCKINLTKNLVPGAMYQVVNGVRYNLNEQLGIPENSSLTELVSAWAKTIPEAELAQFRKNFDRETLLQRFQNGETQIAFSYWTRTANFEPMLAEDHMELFRDTISGDVMAINYVLDRTEQYRLQESKQQLEEKTRELEKLLYLEREYSAILPVLRGIYDQILIVDLPADTFHIVQASDIQSPFEKSMGNARKTFCLMAQRNVMDSYRQSMSEFVDFDSVIQRLSDTDSIFSEYMDKDGNWRSLSFLVKERDGAGTPTQLLFTIRNINRQKEEELLQQKLTEIRLQTVTEAIHGGFKLGKNDSRFSFIMVSEQLAKMLGYDSPDELMEASGGCMQGLADAKIAHQQVPQALRSVEAGEMYTMRYPVRCKDGSWKNIEDRGRLIVNEKGEEEYWSFIVDQDELVKTAEALESARRANAELNQTKNELKEARDRADAANRAKTQFLFNMSHDIRTPMNALLGYNQLLKNGLTDPKLLHYQKKMEQSGNLLLSIINNVLDMARIESGKMELDENYAVVEEVVDEIMAVFASTAKKKELRLIYEKNVAHPNIMCDVTKVKQIFVNLVSNAVKYTPAGGTVTFRTQELPCEEAGFVIIRTEVEDTGIGMSKDFLPKLYDAFSRERNTTTGKVAGTGLGMPIVKELVEKMGGTIQVESELGHGTKFTVTLRHKIADEKYYKKESEENKVISQAAFKDKRILMAEDNDLNAEIAAAILEGMGFKVDRVEDGIQCVSAMEQKPAGTYDLILMDIQMPNMDGYKATEAIRRLGDKKKANIPIVAMTANAFEEDKKEALSRGMNAHLAKPWDVQKAVETIARCIGSTGREADSVNGY